MPIEELNIIDKSTESAPYPPEVLQTLELAEDDSDEVVLAKLRQATTYIATNIQMGFSPSTNEEWQPVIYLARATLLMAKTIMGDNGNAAISHGYLRESWNAIRMVCENGQYTDYRMLFSIMQSIASLIHDRPRLKYAILQRMNAVSYDHRDLELCSREWIESEMAYYKKNIAFADQGRLDEIQPKREDDLRYDPIEWTEKWEKNIDKAIEIAESELTEYSRGMGFCFAYWDKLQHVLWEHFNIRWRTPDEMNPEVRFD